MATEVSTPEVEAPEVESPASGSSEVVAKKHPRYDKMITDAIADLGSGRRGSSFVAIRKYLQDKYNDKDGYKLPGTFSTLLTKRLNQLTDDGKLVKVERSFKLLTVKKHKAAKSKPRGRPPKAAKAAAPKPRGRPPKAAKTAAAPKPRGRPPKAAKTAAQEEGGNAREESFHSREEDWSQ